MPKKAMPSGAQLTNDGLAQLVQKRLDKMTAPSAAELDLARKLVVARRKAGEKGALTTLLAETLERKLWEWMDRDDAPANILDVIRKYAGPISALMRAASPEEYESERLRLIGEGALAMGLDLSRLPFSVESPKLD